MAKLRKLTPRQERFIAEYVKDCNGTRAAILAGYSPRTAQEQASRLLSRVIVATAVRAGLDRVLEQAALDAATLEMRNTELIELDPAVLQDDRGNLKPLRDIPVSARRWIRRIRVRQGRNTTKVLDYQLYDKNAAMDLDYRRHRLFRDRLELDANEDLLKKFALLDAGRARNAKGG